MAVILSVLAVLLGASLIAGSDEEQPARPLAARAAPLRTIERRVERLRELRFRPAPAASRVTPRQARREGLADLDRTYPRARRLADEEVLKLLGLIAAAVDLREASSSVFGGQVAGYYDPHTRRLRTVSGAATAGRVLTELVLAHELTHALEDQAFGLDEARLGGRDDRSLAYLALVEGSASQVMDAYGERFFSAEELLGGTLASAFAGTGGLPPFLTAQLVFPYERGLAFVQRLYAAAGNRPTLVDAAYRSHPPTSTEQILHPDAYLRFERPLPVRLDPGRVLGAGWRRAVRGVLGEFGTRELLSAGGGGAGPAAAGWGGDRLELWRRPGSGCAAPCVARDALAIRWRWDRPADEREFLAALRRWLAQGLRARAVGSERWSARAGGVALARSGAGVTLAFAPSPALAARLAQGA